MIRSKVELLKTKTPPARPTETIVDTSSGGGGTNPKHSWMGQVTSCTRSTGLVTVKRATGTLPNLTVADGEAEVEVWNGPYNFPWKVGEFVHLVYSGAGVTPEWRISQEWPGWYTPPDDGVIAPLQYAPSLIAECG